MSASFTNQVLAQIELAKNAKNYEKKGVHAAQEARRGGGAAAPRQARRGPHPAHQVPGRVPRASRSRGRTSRSTTATDGRGGGVPGRPRQDPARLAGDTLAARTPSREAARYRERVPELDSPRLAESSTKTLSGVSARRNSAEGTSRPAAPGSTRYDARVDYRAGTRPGIFTATRLGDSEGLVQADRHDVPVTLELGIGHPHPRRPAGAVD